MTVGAKFTLDGVEERWRVRRSRLRELEEQYATVAPVLLFYGPVLDFQRDVACASIRAGRPGLPLRERIDLALAASSLPTLFALTIESGPELLAAKASSLREAGEAQWRELLRSAIAAPAALPDEASSFFARACLQPIAENIQLQLPEDAHYTGSVCPACGALPQGSVLRAEGEGARRWLLCSFCLREWVFRRVVCPWCGEQDKEKLPHYSAEEHRHVRIESCDACKRYLKAVDLSIDGRAVPLVDEVALVVLDVWATRHGYTKIARNVMGF